MKEVAVNKSEVKEEQTIEFYKTEPINNEYSNDSNSDSQEYRYEEKKKAPTRKKQNYAKQTMRLTQYSYNEVTEAINNANKHFIENVECIKCGFVGTNARALSAHMSHLHKSVYAKLPIKKDFGHLFFLQGSQRTLVFTLQCRIR